MGMLLPFFTPDRDDSSYHQHYHHHLPLVTILMDVNETLPPVDQQLFNRFWFRFSFLHFLPIVSVKFGRVVLLRALRFPPILKQKKIKRKFKRNSKFQNENKRN